MDHENNGFGIPRVIVKVALQWFPFSISMMWLKWLKHHIWNPCTKTQQKYSPLSLRPSPSLPGFRWTKPPRKSPCSSFPNSHCLSIHDDLAAASKSSAVDVLFLSGCQNQKSGFLGEWSDVMVFFDVYVWLWAVGQNAYQHRLGDDVFLKAQVACSPGGLWPVAILMVVLSAYWTHRCLSCGFLVLRCFCWSCSFLVFACEWVFF